MATRWQLEPGKSFADTVAPVENQVICQPSPHLGIRTCTVLALNILCVCSELWNIWLPLSFPCSSEPSSISQYQINGFKQCNPCWYENSSTSGLTLLLGSSLLSHPIRQSQMFCPPRATTTPFCDFFWSWTLNGWLCVTTSQHQFKHRCPSSLQCNLFGLCKALLDMPHQDLREDSQGVEQHLGEGSERPEVSQLCSGPHRD